MGANTDFQKPAQEARDAMLRYQALAIGSGIATVGLAIASWLLWPNESYSVGLAPGGLDSLGLSFRYNY